MVRTYLLKYFFWRTDAGEKMTKTEEFLNGVSLGTYALAFGWLVWLKKSVFVMEKLNFLNVGH